MNNKHTRSVSYDFRITNDATSYRSKDITSKTSKYKITVCDPNETKSTNFNKTTDFKTNVFRANSPSSLRYHDNKLSTLESLRQKSIPNTKQIQKKSLTPIYIDNKKKNRSPNAKKNMNAKLGMTGSFFFPVRYENDQNQTASQFGKFNKNTMNSSKTQTNFQVKSPQSSEKLKRTIKPHKSSHSRYIKSNDLYDPFDSASIQGKPNIGQLFSGGANLFKTNFEVTKQKRIEFQEKLKNLEGSDFIKNNQNFMNETNIWSSLTYEESLKFEQDLAKIDESECKGTDKAHPTMRNFMSKFVGMGKNLINATLVGFRREGKLITLREKILKPINIEKQTYQCFKIFYGDRQFPAKVRVFSNVSNMAIGISFEKCPEFENCDYMNQGNFLIIDKGHRPPEPRFSHDLYISVFARDKIYGTVGVVFSGAIKQEIEQIYFEPDTIEKCWEDASKMKEELNNMKASRADKLTFFRALTKIKKFDCLKKQFQKSTKLKDDISQVITKIVENDEDNTKLNSIYKIMEKKFNHRSNSMGLSEIATIFKNTRRKSVRPSLSQKVEARSSAKQLSIRPNDTPRGSSKFINENTKFTESNVKEPSKFTSEGYVKEPSRFTSEGYVKEPSRFTSEGYVKEPSRFTTECNVKDSSKLISEKSEESTVKEVGLSISKISENNINNQEVGEFEYENERSQNYISEPSLAPSYCIKKMISYDEEQSKPQPYIIINDTAKQIKNTDKNNEPKNFQAPVVNIYKVVQEANLKAQNNLREIKTHIFQATRKHLLIQKIIEKEKSLTKHEVLKRQKEEKIEYGQNLCLNYSFRQTWVLFIKNYLVTKSIYCKFEAALSQKYKEKLHNFCAYKLQKNFKQHMLMKTKNNENCSVQLIIKSSLSMFAMALKKRVSLQNKRRLALYQPKFVRVYEVKLFFDQFISNNISFINRFKRHSRNVKMNFKMFQKHWDREVMTLMNYEDFNKKRKKQTEIFKTIKISDYMENFSKEFRWKQFKVFYNARLIPFLQARYYLKENKKKMQKKSIDKSSPRLEVYELDIDQEEHIRKNIRDKSPRKSKVFIKSEVELEVERTLHSSFNLDEIIKFDKTLEILKNDNFYILYMEAVNRWNLSHYENLQQNLQKMSKALNSKKQEKIIVGKALMGSFLTTNFTQQDYMRLDSDYGNRSTVDGIKQVFAKAEDSKFIMDFPVEFIRVLVITSMDFISKKLHDIEILKMNKVVASFLTFKNLELFSDNIKNDANNHLMLSGVKKSGEDSENSKKKKGKSTKTNANEKPSKFSKKSCSPTKKTAPVPSINNLPSSKNNIKLSSKRSIGCAQKNERQDTPKKNTIQCHASIEQFIEK